MSKKLTFGRTSYVLLYVNELFGGTCQNRTGAIYPGFQPRALPTELRFQIFRGKVERV